jgi:hypothetical protein
MLGFNLFHLNDMHDAPNPKSQQPLGMTVYDLPSPSDVAQADAKRTAMGRLRMLMVLLVCAAPVVASYFTYYVVRPEGRRNFGDLIEPMRALPHTNVRTLSGETLDLASLKDQWLLVSVAGGACDDGCQRNLYLQRQILTSLGKDRPRADWVWLVSDDVTVPSAIEPGLKEATVLRIAPEALNAWLAPAQGAALQDHLYVVDPHGQWMMRFPAKLDDQGAIKAKRDLERLLRAAASWDEPGR